MQGGLRLFNVVSPLYNYATIACLPQKRFVSFIVLSHNYLFLPKHLVNFSVCQPGAFVTNLTNDLGLYK